MTKPDYQVNWHHELLCEYLQAFADGEIKKLMVFMPPQHGKSELTSRRLPAYLFGRDPSLRIIGCSYSSSLAIKFCREVQRIIDCDEYKIIFPDTRLSGKNVKTSALGSYKRTSDEFEIVGSTGSYLAAGVGGSITGNPCDIGIIDDPIKGYVEAMSPTVRQNVWGWYSTDFDSRKHNDSRELITQTRWHPQDLSGKVLELLNDNNQWEIVKLEALKTQHYFDSDKRQIGDALWPSRHSKSKILDARKADPLMFEALYQQKPELPKGTLYCHAFDRITHIKDFDLVKSLPIHHTNDFNVNPFMSSLIIQVEFIDDDEWNGYDEYWQVSVYDEYTLTHPDNNSPALGKKLAFDFGEMLAQGFYLYADASGKNRLGVGGLINTHIQGVMSGYGEFRRFCTKRIPTTNPKYARIAPGMVGRRFFLNQLFAGTVPVRMRVHPRCEKFIEDLENAQLDVNGKLDKSKDKTGAERYGHLLQAFEYFACHPKSIGHLATIK